MGVGWGGVGWGGGGSSILGGSQDFHFLAFKGRPLFRGEGEEG